MSDQLYLALDQGGHASRAIAFDRQGRVVAQSVCNVATVHTDDRIEHDPEEMVASLEEAVAQVLNALGERATAVVAAGLATQRSSIGCWDRHSGAALSPIISWQDRRAADWLKRFAGRNAEIHAKTGLFITAHYGASKLRWCLDHLPEVRLAQQEGRLAFGPMASFLLFRLCEEQPLLADPANASRTLLWNFRECDWDPELAAMFGVPRSALPLCVPTRYEFGHLRAERRIPLTILTGDQSAALYAYGLPESDTAYVNIGTGAFVQRPLGEHPRLVEHLLTGVVLHDAGVPTYVLEGTVNGAGSALELIERQLGVRPAEAVAHIDEWLLNEQNPPLFLNGVSGLGAPYWVPHFPSLFIGEGSDRAKIVAVVESICFLILENMQELVQHSGPVRRIVASGGLTAIRGLCQRLADLAGVPVYRPAQCEATARGTAFLLAGKPAIWAEAGQGTHYYPCEAPGLSERYQRWRQALQAALSGL